MRSKFVFPFIIYCMLVSCTYLVSAYGSENSFAQNNTVISAGYGAPRLTGILFKLYKNEPNFSQRTFGPLYIKGEFGLGQYFGLGLDVAYAKAAVAFTETHENYNSATSKTMVFQDNYNLTFTTMSFLIRANYHFLKNNEKFDFYTGGALGYRLAKMKATLSTSDPNPTYFGKKSDTGNGIPVGFDMTTGVRYYFTPNIGLYTELGLAKTLFK